MTPTKAEEPTSLRSEVSPASKRLKEIDRIIEELHTDKDFEPHPRTERILRKAILLGMVSSSADSGTANAESGGEEGKINLKAADEMILGLLFQACGGSKHDEIDNMCMSMYEDACEYLVREGKLSKKNDRIYWIKLTQPQDGGK